jgi:hypothetical protein
MIGNHVAGQTSQLLLLLLLSQTERGTGSAAPAWLLLSSASIQRF